MKLYAPFGNVKHWMSQTRHGEDASNPADISKQIAEDWAAPVNTPVYAGCDGRIVNVSNSAGIYLTLDPGPSSPFWILYVHCKATVANGTVVGRGQQIAVTTGSYGHLHLAMKNKNYQPVHPEPMDYWDRNVPIDTRYQEIKDEWFINNGQNFNWSIFRDLHIPGTEVPPSSPPVDPCEKYKVQVASLKGELDETKKDLLDSVEDFHLLQRQVDKAKSEYDSLFDKHERAKSDLALCQEKYRKDTEKLKTDVKVLEGQLKKCRSGKVDVSDLGVRELLVILWERVWSLLGKLDSSGTE